MPPTLSPWPSPPPPQPGAMALWLDGGLPGLMALACLKAWGVEAIALLPDALPPARRAAAEAQAEAYGAPCVGVAIAGPPHLVAGWGPAWAAALRQGAGALGLPTWRADAREMALAPPPDWALGPWGSEVVAWRAHGLAQAASGHPEAWRPWASWGPAELGQLLGGLGLTDQPRLWCEGAQGPDCGACGGCRAGRRLARAGAGPGPSALLEGPARA